MYPEGYWGYALAVSAGFYGAVNWFGKNHLAAESKRELSLWLRGKYESTWSQHFCSLFDAVFTDRHLSWRCFFRSSVLSVLSVGLLYVLFAHVIGVMGEGARVRAGFTIGEALLLGAVINILPDYLSLYETRWLLKRFEQVRSMAGQLVVLLADALFTGAIIWIAISVFQLVTGGVQVSVIEMVALFSVFSVFFYATFATSAWAWLYCVSTWLMRIFSRGPLPRILDVEEKPVYQIALVGSVVMLVAALVLTPLLKPLEARQASKFDEILCTLFRDNSNICLLIVDYTTDEKQAFRALSPMCERGKDEDCHARTISFFNGDSARAAQLWGKACDGGYLRGCNYLGWMYVSGVGVATDRTRATELFQRACDGGIPEGCQNRQLLAAIPEIMRVLSRDPEVTVVGSVPDLPKRVGGRVTGRVNWFNAAKGYGFIIPDDGSPEIFVHATAIQTKDVRTLRDGERVEYEVWIDAIAHVQASNVTPLDR